MITFARSQSHGSSEVSLVHVSMYCVSEESLRHCLSEVSLVCYKALANDESLVQMTLGIIVFLEILMLG